MLNLHIESTGTRPLDARASRPSPPRRRQGLTLFALASCAVLVGCSGSGDPSAATGEKAVRDAIAEQSGSRIQLVQYSKKDSISGEMMGVKMHSQEFEAELEFAENATWMIGYKGGPFSLEIPNYGMGVPVTKDQRLKVRGEVEFILSDSGWRVKRVDCEEL